MGWTGKYGSIGFLKFSAAMGAEVIMKLSDDDATAFLRVAEPMFQEVLNNNIENLRLSTLRDSLLPKLMSGEIDVSAVQL